MSFPSFLTLPSNPPFLSNPAYLEVGGDPSPKAKCWKPFITGKKKSGVGGHWARPPCPPPPSPTSPRLLPVIVLADASHCTQGLQVVVGLAGAEAV